MCFKKPKLPPKTQEDIEREKELEEARLARRAQLERELAAEKEAQTEAALARALGFVGNRSLISGPKGGAGFLGAGARGQKGRRFRRVGSSSTLLLPPGQSLVSGTGAAMGGGNAGQAGGGYGGWWSGNVYER
jgi:hypothetical protein